MKQYTRKEMIQRLRAKIDAKKPLVGAGAANPLIAHILDEAGCDFIFAYCPGIARVGGFPTGVGTQAYGDADQRCVDFANQASLVVKDTPIICGVGPGDPTMSIERLTDRYMALGYSGMINFPCAGSTIDQLGNPNMVSMYSDTVGAGLHREAEYVKYWRDHDVFSYAYAYTEEGIKLLVGAGVDVVIPHLGLTAGGLVGTSAFGEDYRSVREAQYEKLNNLTELCLKENPDVIVIGHGGILAEPEDIQGAYDRTRIVGFVGASSTERLPIEKGTKHVMEEIRSIRKR